MLYIRHGSILQHVLRQLLGDRLEVSAFPISQFAGSLRKRAKTLAASDHRLLERVARVAADQGDVDAHFLLSEISRSEVVPDRAARLNGIVTMGSWVTFWIDWASLSRRGNWCTPKTTGLSDSNPCDVTVGAALVGLKVGSELLFFTVGRTNIVRLERVSRSNPNDVVQAPFSNPVFQSKTLFDDDDLGPSAAWGGETVVSNIKDKPEIVLPAITVMEDEARRLNALANSSEVPFPRVSHFLAGEIERATIVADNSDLRGVVRMGSQVRYCDDKPSDVRVVVLVYPHEADITLKRVSVLTQVGAALMDLSVGQAMEFQTPGHNNRSLTILGVSN